jgi:hypothetical protein
MKIFRAFLSSESTSHFCCSIHYLKRAQVEASHHLHLLEMISNLCRAPLEQSFCLASILPSPFHPALARCELHAFGLPLFRVWHFVGPVSSWCACSAFTVGVKYPPKFPSATLFRCASPCVPAHDFLSRFPSITLPGYSYIVFHSPRPRVSLLLPEFLLPFSPLAITVHASILSQIDVLCLRLRFPTQHRHAKTLIAINPYCFQPCDLHHSLLPFLDLTFVARHRLDFCLTHRPNFRRRHHLLRVSSTTIPIKTRF